MDERMKKIIIETEEESRFLRDEHPYLSDVSAGAILIASVIKRISDAYAKEESVKYTMKHLASTKKEQ